MSTKYIYEYVWVDAIGELRSKTMVCDTLQPKNAENRWRWTPGTLSEWNFDGSSTGQAEGFRSEVVMKPVAVYVDPFDETNDSLNPHAFLVLCDTHEVDYEVLDLTGEYRTIPHKTNTRARCLDVMKQVRDKDPWFGIEQEYVLVDRNGTPYKWINECEPGDGPQGPYYCSAGGKTAFGRNIATKHREVCLKAGISYCGTNAEVMPSQWEFQIGICRGIQMGDDLLMARYILKRVTELFDNVWVDIHPKPKEGLDWNGSGCHTNYSTTETRQEKGLVKIFEYRDKLALNHKEHMVAYGKDNNLRMIGECETAGFEEFKKGEFNGVADRGASVRIPLVTFSNKRGYLEDRRPGSNCDPYVVTEMIVRTTCLN